MVEQTLAENEIHLWYTNPESINDSIIESYYCFLDSFEREKYSKLSFEKDRKYYLVTRALVRNVLSGYVKRDPKQWKFVENDFGRPFIEPCLLEDELYFSISHTQGLVACAITRHEFVGIDVESIFRKELTMEFAKRYYGVSEIKQISLLTPEKQSTRILEYWLLKEAYLKALGRGFSLPMDAVNFNFDQHGNAKLVVGMENECTKDWLFYPFRISPVHMAAIAMSLQGDDDIDLETYTMVPVVGTVHKKDKKIIRRAGFGEEAASCNKS